MRQRLRILVSTFLVLTPFVAVAGAAGSRTDFYVALVAAAGAWLAAINVWGWARCRSWPEVTATFDRAAPASGGRELRLVYTYGDSTYSRPAQTRGEIGASVSLKVDPSNPGLSSLLTSRPDLAIATLALAACALVATAASAVIA